MKNGKKSESGKKEEGLTCDDYIAYIRSFIVSLKIPENRCAETRSDDGDSHNWTLDWQEVDIFVSILGLNSHDPEHQVFRVESFVANFPETMMLAFYRRCLELNDTLQDGSICVRGKEIVMTTERLVAYLTPNEMIYKLSNIMQQAPGVSKALSDEFGSTCKPDES